MYFFNNDLASTRSFFTLSFITYTRAVPAQKTSFDKTIPAVKLSSVYFYTHKTRSFKVRGTNNFLLMYQKTRTVTKRARPSFHFEFEKGS